MLSVGKEPYLPVVRLENRANGPVAKQAQIESEKMRDCFKCDIRDTCTWAYSKSAWFDKVQCEKVKQEIQTRRRERIQQLIEMQDLALAKGDNDLVGSCEMEIGRIKELIYQTDLKAVSHGEPLETEE